MDKWINSPRARFLCGLLRKIREAEKLEQETVAASLGVYQSYISVYEDVQKRLDFFQLDRIARALRTTRHKVLVEFEEHAPPEEYVGERVQVEHESAAEQEAWDAIASLEPAEAEAAFRLGQLLKSLRKSAGLRQKDIATTLGKPQSWMSKIENGKVRVDVIQLGEIVYQLDTPLHVLDELLEGPEAGGAEG